MPSCGTLGPDEIYDDHSETAEAYDCLYGAFVAGEPADLEVTQMTEEGDPVTEVWRVIAPEQLEILVDARQDDLASYSFAHKTCTALARQDEVGEIGLIPAECATGQEDELPAQGESQ